MKHFSISHAYYPIKKYDILNLNGYGKIEFIIKIFKVIIKLNYNRFGKMCTRGFIVLAIWLVCLKMLFMFLFLVYGCKVILQVEQINDTIIKIQNCIYKNFLSPFL